MRMNTIRILQIVAVALFVVALLISVISIPAQNIIKQFYSADDSLFTVRVVPYASIISCLLYGLFAVVCLLLFLQNPSRQATMVITVISAILFVLLDTIILRLVSIRFTHMYAKRDTIDIAAYTYVESGVGILVSLFTVPAKALLFLSLGGACANNCRAEKE